MASIGVQPPLNSTSEQPPLFDGTTRLYTSYSCPYAQRVWITRNYKGLQDKIELVPIDLSNKPAWYKEKVYPEGKVPSLKHNGKVLGESLDLIKYVDANFEGTPLFPNVSPASDFLENALGKFDDGPFFLGQFSLVDIAYIPFVERFHIVLAEVFKHDITEGRPKLATWIEELNKIGAYTQTRVDPQIIVDKFKERHMNSDLILIFLFATWLKLVHFYCAASTVKVELQQTSSEIFL
ncbi:putative glutathione transferase [Medicago truncatula]|uniref:Putative glutathione transferase n=1 Tax=Medicago truncatula TaxID=3880 RepID=A0A396JSV0_MEDTR|nr:putative glutathione transferase [Medicago truncatula]